jgi:hypothetical protein
VSQPRFQFLRQPVAIVVSDMKQPNIFSRLHGGNESLAPQRNGGYYGHGIVEQA